MLALLHLDPQDPIALRAYRLQVKERLYRFNFVGILPSMFLTDSDLMAGNPRST